MTTALPKAMVRRLRDEFGWLGRSSRSRRIRTISEFSETLTIPEGKFKGRRFRLDRQPFVALAYAEIESKRWRRIAAVGCVQSGKTLQFSVIPALYTLFELAEPYIYGVPTMDMGADKWRKELLPAIQASGFDRYLPTKGSGSKGATKVDAVTFTNGAEVRFMSGSGGDEKRSGYTARVVGMTEVDKYDTATASGEETDPVSQMEARALASGDEAWILLECTVTHVAGRIWLEYTSGTESKIVAPCPNCGEYVCPEREHLKGWQDAKSVKQAERQAHWECPACSEVFLDADRCEMMRHCKLLHRGQTIDRDGVIHGDPPETDTLGFRWNAFHNMFWETSFIAAEEWKAARADNHEDAQRKIRQFFWVIPDEPEEVEFITLDAAVLREKKLTFPKGVVPPEAVKTTVGVDCGKWNQYWVCTAWMENGAGHVVDYARLRTPPNGQRPELVFWSALNELSQRIFAGWPTPDGNIVIPDRVWIDCGFNTEYVCRFCRELRGPVRFWPVHGLGFGQAVRRNYTAPKKTGNTVRWLGDNYHGVWSVEHRVEQVEINVDRWKTDVQEGLAAERENPGSISFYASNDPNEHNTLIAHCRAETPLEKFIPGRGPVTVWENAEKKPNHLFDSLTYSAVAAHQCGVRILKERRPVVSKPSKPVQASGGFQTPDGRPFMVTERY